MAGKVRIQPRAPWEAQKAKLKARFTQLMDTDLDFDETRKNEMLTRLQIKTNRTVKELTAIMETR